MDNNFNENTINNIKNMVDSGNISEAISQISPEMIQNFSKMLSKNSNQSNNESTSQENFSNQSNSTSNDSSNLNNSDFNFNFNNIDINTLMKFSSVFNNMNNKNDPRANLLNSLRPYLRDGKQNKLDNYINLLNVSKIADIMKANNNNKENSDA